MKRHELQLLALLLLALTAACVPIRSRESAIPAPAGNGPIDVPVMDVETPVPSQDGESAHEVTEVISVETATRTDEAYGYTFDYPSAWMLDAVVYGSRAPGGYQITSWSHEPGMISDVLPGETVVNILVQLWDPKADLAAFIDQRKFAWDASGIEIVFEEDVTLAGDKPAKEFVTQSQGQGSYTLFTTLGENYLVVSGVGDLEAVRRVAWSIR